MTGSWKATGMLPRLGCVALAAALVGAGACDTGRRDVGEEGRQEREGEPALGARGGEERPGRPGEMARGDTVEVGLDEYSIRMPTTLPAGPTVFAITNEGTEEHNFEIEGQGIEESLESNLPPHETEILSLELEPGTYEVYCPVANHRERGMSVTLEVRPGGEPDA